VYSEGPQWRDNEGTKVPPVLTPVHSWSLIRKDPVWEPGVHEGYTKRPWTPDLPGGTWNLSGQSPWTCLPGVLEGDQTPGRRLSDTTSTTSVGVRGGGDHSWRLREVSPLGICGSLPKPPKVTPLSPTSDVHVRHDSNIRHGSYRAGWRSWGRRGRQPSTLSSRSLELPFRAFSSCPSRAGHSCSGGRRGAPNGLGDGTECTG
jgi:hypothetical protein